MAKHTYGAPPKTSGEAVKNSRKKINTSTIIIIIIMILMLIGAAIFGIFAFNSHMETVEVVQLWDEVANIAEIAEPLSNTVSNTSSVVPDNNSSQIEEDVALSTDPIDKEFDWDALLNINSDVMCWIYIPGTEINYPIMQEKVLGEYFYELHDIYGNYLRAGSLFTPKQPDGYDGKDMHILVLGHNMKNGTMFSSLRKYLDETFYWERPYIYLYYPDKTEKWHVWATYRTYADDMIYDIPYEKDSDAYKALLDDIISKRDYVTNTVDPTTSDRILSLTTCDWFDAEQNGRFVVNAVIEEVKYKQ
ncbi:class B sortase [bacterium]|nr:class B sortase [bacterium]